MMARCNVKYNGQFAAFSTVTDSFITQFTDRNSFNKWRKKEYGEKVCSLEVSNFISINEAALFARMNRKHDKAVEVLVTAGIPVNESEILIRRAEECLNKNKIKIV